MGPSWDGDRISGNRPRHLQDSFAHPRRRHRATVRRGPGTQVRSEHVNAIVFRSDGNPLGPASFDECGFGRTICEGFGSYGVRLPARARPHKTQPLCGLTTCGPKCRVKQYRALSCQWPATQRGSSHRAHSPTPSPRAQHQRRTRGVLDCATTKACLIMACVMACVPTLDGTSKLTFGLSLPAG